MRTAIGISLGFLALCQEGRAQGPGFNNLGFEQSTIISSRPSGGGFNTGTAKVPSWTEYNGWGDSDSPSYTTLIYNNQPLDDAGVSLVGTDYWPPAIQGNYSIFLFGGTSASESGPNGAAIGQTGTIPSYAKSVTYLCYNFGSTSTSVQVSFNGQVLPLYILGIGANYLTYGADVSTYEGQTGQLLFSVPQEGGGVIDGIQFSALPAPEPGIIGLIGVGGLLLIWRRKLKGQEHADGGAIPRPRLNL
jgi:hypothetical protein